ncbi:hypothetical protein KOM00_14650 [Geomonas sp. Red69]|uniref:hypothetical protein n=1 Tax=Geomonas diazotrophica TaxID=2843197 RepID=UPI001C1267A1|nr:hypothetical protein [Geomonas diazotrophica]MBU5637966.1 hypothetical protein [Geomonas diazotrophica]
MVRSMSRARLGLFAAVFSLLLSGCAGTRGARGPVFFPPAPDLPRIQYLGGFSNSADVEGKDTSLSLLSIGGVDQKKVIPIVKPYGVAVGKGKIYIADLGGRVLIADPANKTFTRLKGDNGIGKLKKPIQLAVDELGSLFVADNGRKEVLVYDPQGEFVRAVGLGGDAAPASVAVDAERLYVLDTRKGAIRVFDRQTFEQVKEIGTGDGAEQSLSLPITMAIDSKGVIRVTNAGNGKVMSFDKDGHFIAAFGDIGDGFGQFSRPKGIAVDDNGYLFVVDAAFQNVQVLNEKGQILMYFGGVIPYGGMNLPAGVAVGKDSSGYYQGLAEKNFEVEQIVVVANQFGDPKVGIYGFGKQKGIDYDKEYQRILKERLQRIQELKEKQKVAPPSGKETGATEAK